MKRLFFAALILAVLGLLMAPGAAHAGEPTHFFGPPPGVTIDPVTGKFDWTPTRDQVGIWTMTVRATDAQGLFAEETFTISVFYREDLTRDWSINVLDLVKVGQYFGQVPPEDFDVNLDGTANILDLVLVGQSFE